MASRLRPVVCSGIATLAVLVTVPSFSSTAGAAEPEAVAPPAEAGIPEPDGGSSPISAPEAGSEADAVAPASPSDAMPEPTEAPPLQTVEPSPPALPDAPADDVAPPAATAEPAPTPEPEAEPALDPSLLDAPETEPTAPVSSRPATRSRGEGMSPEERSAALDAAIAARYRPPENPVRLNIAGRLMFANVSGKEKVNGRIGGASVDVGPAWNRLALAGTITGWGGRIQLPEGSGAEMNAMLGGGLSLGLGRLALLTHGYLDLRLGYDVYYGVVNQRSDSPTILAPQDDDAPIVAELTENLLPHGPRARLDLGLVGAGNRRFFHGFGMSMGYQALIGSFSGTLPPTSMLTLGFSYWMG